MDTTELERLRKLYPLFRFEQQDDDDYIQVHFSEYSSRWLKLKDGRIDSKILEDIDRRHAEKFTSQSLMSLYPDLRISVCINGTYAYVWVKRDDRDAESIGHVELVSSNLHETLGKWQDEARKAKREGYFMCSGHQRAEPVEEFDFFYFAGKYCRQYAEEDPKLKEMAQAETYE